MPIIENIPITVKLDDLVRSHMPRGAEVAQARLDALKGDAQRALDLLPDLVEPKMAYEVFPVEGIDGEQVVLENGHTLRVGEHAHLLEPAEAVILGINTIGDHLDHVTQEYFNGNDPLLGLMLDSAGVLALGWVGETAFQLAEQIAGERGAGVSPSFGPGTTPGWDVARQKEIVALLPVDEIGVHLSGSGLLVPYKSVSYLVGIGAGFSEYEVGSLCHLCALADTCWRRK